MYLIIDQGTSSTKGFLFEKTGGIFHEEKIKHRIQTYSESKNSFFVKSKN